MDQPAVLDLRSSSDRQSKSLSSQPTHYPTVRPQKRSFLSVLNHIRRRVFSRLLSHPIPSRIPIPIPNVETKVECEVLVISRPVNVQVHMVPRKVHYETVRRRKHREEPILQTFQLSMALSRRFKRPSTAPQLQNYGSGKSLNAFIPRREKKQAWSVNGIGRIYGTSLKT
ncbi:hypothetical protein ARMSODRAFT_1027990 [Armillaria solidipes]|uniref:Uncharacterized protein n=1 Tax=Armillaria solidipes TaxID=1076256 RepID=A0A2H3B6T0_9AGAR|nr:hypothetical protein ARMSODRAFT_1027990 [Armillaria solidipes]